MMETLYLFKIDLFPNSKLMQKILVENDLNFCYNQLKYRLGNKSNIFFSYSGDNHEIEAFSICSNYTCGHCQYL